MRPGSAVHLRLTQLLPGERAKWFVGLPHADGGQWWADPLRRECGRGGNDKHFQESLFISLDPCISER